MVYTTLNFILKKDYIGGSGHSHVITLENMPNFYAGTDNFCASVMIDANMQNNTHISICDIAVTNGSNYRFNNGIRIDLNGWTTIPAGTRIICNLLYFTNYADL